MKEQSEEIWPMSININQTRTVFISYAREDEDLILPAAHLLRAAGAIVFLDLEDIPYGDKWEATLLEQLRASERILVFWSVNAANSEWVRREYLTAIGLGLRVVPVPLDATPLPEELATFQALAALAPLVYQIRRSRAPRAIRGLIFERNGMALMAMMLTLMVTAILYSPITAEGAEPRLLTEHSAWFTGTVALVLLLSRKWTPLSAQKKSPSIQVAIYDAVFGETTNVEGA